jgi:hypothetical protein
METLVKNLKLLKALVYNLEKKKKHEAKEELVKIEFELDLLYFNLLGGFYKEEDKVLIVEKEQRKLLLLI